jgi:pimeloyl-ACP methyl ester carboxylesterase
MNQDRSAALLRGTNQLSRHEPGGSPALRLKERRVARHPCQEAKRVPAADFLRLLLLGGLCVLLSGCAAPIGADKTAPFLAYRQTHENPVSHGQPSPATRFALHRFQQAETFEGSPDEALKVIQEKAVETRERGLLFALSELNYLAGERVRASLKPWDPRDARDYYLASAVHAWLFLFGDATGDPPDAFDERGSVACDLYNYALGWALTGRRSTNASVILAGGVRRLPFGRMEIEFKQSNFPFPLSSFEEFVLADHFVVRGLSVRNRQPGLGTPLVAVAKPDKGGRLPRGGPATVLLRPEGGLSELAQGRLRGSLELYSTYDSASFQVGGRTVPLETDTTVPMAYALNAAWVWKLGMLQFLSSEERVPTDIYLTQPHRPGRIPVVFVHGTFSSPVWWAEMANTLNADPLLRRRFEFWYFIYNSGNMTAVSAAKLRQSLEARVQELDPEGRDAALRQMVVIGHSQGGLLTKLTATDTGDRLLRSVVKTNRLGKVKLSAEDQANFRQLTVFESLPFVKRVVFICTPHRGSYAAGNVVRNLARKLVSFPSALVKRAAELTGLQEALGFPKEMRGMRTSLDSMSPKNPALLALADIPLAPGVKGHSIIAVQGNGDYHRGKDGLVSYESAHVDYVESEFIVRSFHSCQDKPPTIEEVRRILHEHLKSVPAGTLK